MELHGRRLGAILMLLGGLLIGGSARADLITNGDFETGDFTGWTLTGSATDPFQFPNFAVDNVAPHSGNFGAYFGLVGVPGGVQQTLATIAGVTYHVDFWLMSETDVTGATGGNTFQFSWGGMVENVGLSSATDMYQHYSLDLVATSNATALDFSFQNDVAFWDLDDVSVARVPEPGSLALISLGFVAACASRRRRRA